MLNRVFVLLLLVALLPWVTGCDELAKATPNNTGEKAKVVVPPAELSAAKKPATDVLSFSPTDPLIANAIQSRTQLIQQEEELLERLDELRTLLASAKADPARMRQSVNEFLEITKELRKLSSQAGESINNLIDRTNELSRSMRHLASSYRATADLFRKKARDYTESKLRDQLNGFANDHEQIAKLIPEHLKATEVLQKTLLPLKGKIREANAFLEDVGLFLSSHPGIGIEPSERYAGQVESFVVTFSEWLRTLNELRQSLREHAVSKNIQEAYRKEVLVMKQRDEAKRAETMRAEQAKQEAIVQAERAKRAEEARLVQIAEQQQQAKARAEAERERLAHEPMRVLQNSPRVNAIPTVPCVPFTPEIPIMVSTVRYPVVPNSVPICSQPIYITRSVYSPCQPMRVVIRRR